MTWVRLLEGALEPFALGVAVVAEAIAALVIAVALVQAICGAGRLLVQRATADVQEAKQDLRLGLARWLVLSLEFLLAADILRTAVAPTWDEIGKLAAVATLRTLLNYFLEREIAQDERSDRRRTADQPSRASADR